MGKSKSKKAAIRKASYIKINNKKLNKLAKQGKLKKRKDKLRKKVLNQERRNNQVDEKFNTEDYDADEPLDEDDVEYYGTPGINASFASNVQDSSFANTDDRFKRKRKTQDNDAMEQFEKLPRTLYPNGADKSLKHLLPIKVKDKVIPQTAEIDSGDEKGEDDEHNQDEKAVSETSTENSESPTLSAIQLLALRKRNLIDSKKRIASLSSSVIENPQENIKKLKELRMMLWDTGPHIPVTVRKLVMISMMEIFRDIIPGYRIRLLTDKEKQQQVKKETKSLVDFEEGLLKNYRVYLEFLEKTARGTYRSNNKMNKGKMKDDDISRESAKALSLLAVRCLCNMLTNHPHFNYRNNIVTVLMPFITKSHKASDVVCDAVKQVFKEDKSGEVTLEIVRSIGRIVKARNYDVKPKVLNTFLSLKIKEIDKSTSTEKKASEKRKEKLERLSRREKKRKKEQTKLEHELLEIRGTEDKKRKLKMHTEIIQSVFVTYFRVLKNYPESKILSAVLEGLAKFAHLINVEFFNDLFTVFNELIDSGVLNYRESLHCIQTAFTILSGQGSALNIDPVRFYRHLYQTVLQLNSAQNSEDLPIILECLDMMITKRRNQLSQQRILAYLKRLSTLCLHQLPHTTLALLCVIRKFIQTYRFSELLFDTEMSGSGVYLPELDDPEHCNAHNSTLWELHLLKKHYLSEVRSYADHVSRVAPSTGQGQLTIEKARMTPMNMYKRYSVEADSILSSMPQTAKKKSKRKEFKNGSYEEKFGNYLQEQMAGIPDTPDIELSLDIT